MTLAERLAASAEMCRRLDMRTLADDLEEAISALRSPAREQALEEAAKICDKFAYKHRVPNGQHRQDYPYLTYGFSERRKMPRPEGVHDAALELAANVCEQLTYALDIEDWMSMSKKQHGAHACRECAKAIRALRSRGKESNSGEQAAIESAENRSTQGASQNCGSSVSKADSRPASPASPADLAQTKDTPRVDALLLEINEGRVYGTDGPITELARTLERQLRLAETALRELVACKDLKESLEAHDSGERVMTAQESDRVHNDYERRKPKAWEAVPAALGARPIGNAR